MKRPLRVAIVGAGLGGLVTAISARRASFDVTVYEQASVLGEIGAGIQVGPNAVKVLRALDLEAGLDRFGATPEHHVARNWRSGRILFKSSTRLGCIERFGAAFYQVQRSDLHAHLRSALPPDIIKLGMRCVAVESGPDAAKIRFADGTEAQSDVIVGADGVHSTVRDCLLGPTKADFTGVMCWRGQVSPDKLPAGLIPPDSLNWMGPGGCCVHYFVRPGKLVNWVAQKKSDTWAEESWSVEGDKDELLAAFAGWHESLHTLFKATERCYKWALLARDPLPRWSSGRITLLGDAAHPMLPFLAQGGALAMEDGFILAQALKRSPDDVPAALLHYEALRTDRATRVQIASRDRAEACQLTSPLAQMQRDLKYLFDQWFHPGAAIRRADWVYAYDVATVPV